MKASTIILESKIIEDRTRGEALELLTDLVFEHYGYGHLRDSLSNGGAIDAILVLFDRLIEDDHDQEMALLASIDAVVLGD